MNASKYNIMLPRNIAKTIKELGLKNSAVAEKAGYTSQQLSDMLNGRRIIKPCDILAISDALGVGVEELFAEVRSSA